MENQYFFAMIKYLNMAFVVGAGSPTVFAGQHFNIGLWPIHSRTARQATSIANTVHGHAFPGKWLVWPRINCELSIPFSYSRECVPRAFRMGVHAEWPYTAQQCIIWIFVFILHRYCKRLRRALLAFIEHEPHDGIIFSRLLCTCIRPNNKTQNIPSSVSKVK